VQKLPSKTHYKRKDRRKDRSKGKMRKKMKEGDLKERTGYYKLKVEALDHTLWRTCFGRGYGPFVKETTE
jgi:hypothetical protein